MNKHIFIFTLILITAWIVMPCSMASEKQDMIFWYNTKPGDVWTEPLPIGNGYLAGLVYGKVQDERISLNETSFWSGRPHDYDDPNASKHFKQIQELVFARKYKEAEKMINENFYGKPAAQQAYQPLGDLRLFFLDIDNYETRSYYRDLNMETGVTTVSFVYDGVTYKREAYVSYPDNVMVVKITADKPGRISFDAWLDSYFEDNTKAEPGKLVLDGVWEGPLPKYWLIAPVDGKGMKFQTVLKAVNEGGESGVAKNKLTIRKANSVTLLLTAATSHVNYKDISGDPAASNRKIMDNIAGKSYDTLYKRHVDAFSSLMGRVHLSVGDKKLNEKPINERIRAVQEGTDDPNMEALCFQFGRYMLVSSSREGGQTSNLQAIWNEKLAPPWGGKYTININIQMNYWPAEVTNLAECHLPLFDMIKDISETGAKTANAYYGVNKGWVTHHNLDIWRGTAPVDAARYGMWPVGGAWLCQHIWEHYAYSKDIEFLKKYYPVLKGSAEFLANLLVEYPGTKYLVTPFSMSPEHGFYDGENQELCYISPGPTMDIAIMRELFPHVIEASKLLKVDTPLRKQLETTLAKLPPYKVNQLGYPQEWIEDFKPQRGGHDVSPYFPFYPGNSILLRRPADKEMVDAYNRWLESRSIRGGGFPGAWNICMWARLERGDKTSEFIQSAVNRVASQVLLQGTGAQVDGSFGFTAGIAECLIQSHADEISLLPALPSRWQSSGEISGLRARGGYEVNIQWTNGKVISAEISNKNGGECNVRYNNKVVKINVPKDKPFIITD
ncbi:MAG: glycoside hydrolase family 95 protein [Tannerellaceae bacterium]|jgi:alpha-L-fucosidase 2|nr:glycoside hydrolase family 95 protein [Tannerellaceae bacterium]